MNLAVIGCGYWGKNLIRNFYKTGHLKYISDIDEDNLNKILHEYPNLIPQTPFNIFTNNNIDGVIIATPANTHYELVKKALKYSKDVFVEKPFTLNLKEAEELTSEAKKLNKILMVGMTFLYNPVVKQIKKIIDSGDIGDIYYIYSQRLNLGRIRKDTDVWWNLAPHDISIFLYWLKSKPKKVNASGYSFLQKNKVDVVVADIEFENGTVAFIQNSWLEPNKIRKMTIVGTKKMIVWDDTATDRKIEIYDKGIDVVPTKHFKDYRDYADFQFVKRSGDIHIPKIESDEPLFIEAQHFVECIEKRKDPLTSAKNNIEIMRILEDAQKSYKKMEN